MNDRDKYAPNKLSILIIYWVRSEGLRSMDFHLNIFTDCWTVWIFDKGHTLFYNCKSLNSILN